MNQQIKIGIYEKLSEEFIFMIIYLIKIRDNIMNNKY